MRKTKVISALKAQAMADKEKALMVLDLLENQGVGIGDHTANDFLKDATEALQLLVDADDKLEAIEKYFNNDD
jgi:predicted transcriptional regulator